MSKNTSGCELRVKEVLYPTAMCSYLVQVLQNVLDCKNTFTMFECMSWVFVKKMTMC